MNSKFSLHFTSLSLVFLLLVLMSACQTDDSLVPSEEGMIAHENAFLLTTDISSFLDGPDDCRCRYEVLDVVIDNPPTLGAGDHPEFQFYSTELCNSTFSTTYFSAFIGQCDDPLGNDPGTDYFPDGTTNTTAPGLGSPHYFNCDVPRFDVYDLDMNYMWWQVGSTPNCNFNTTQLSGIITYRIICQDNAIGIDFECRPSSEYVSNTMSSTFTGGSGSAGLDEETRVRMGVLFSVINNEPVLNDGCGCEPYIEEY